MSGDNDLLGYYSGNYRKFSVEHPEEEFFLDLHEGRVSEYFGMQARARYEEAKGNGASYLYGSVVPDGNFWEMKRVRELLRDYGD